MSFWARLLSLLCVFWASCSLFGASGSSQYDGATNNGTTPVIKVVFEWNIVTTVHTDGRLKHTVTWSQNWEKFGIYVNSNIGYGFQMGAPWNNGIAGDFPNGKTASSGSAVGVSSGVAIIYCPANTTFPKIGTALPSATLCQTGAYVNMTYLGVGDQPQTVTLSPNGGAATLVTGQTFNGTASGAQSGNAYNISVVSGSAGASMNSSTGAYTVTPSGAGLVTYKVWISEGGGYSRSADAQASISVTASKKVTVTIPANNSEYPITYTLKQGDVVIGTHVQQPGATAHIVQIDVGANDGLVTLTATTTGIKKDGVSYIDDPLQEVTEVISETLVPDSSGTPVDVTPPKTNDTQKPDSSTGPVWDPGNGSSDAAAQTDLLTNKVFREGVDKLLKGSETGVNSVTLLDVSTAGSPDANVSVAGVDALIAKLPAKPTFGAPGSSSVLTITLPLMSSLTSTQNYTFTWDYSPWVTILSWLRTLMLGCISVFFFFAINKQLRDSVAN